MTMNRRLFTKSVAAGALGSFVPALQGSSSADARKQTAPATARAATRLSPTKITRIRVLYPPNYDRNGPQAFPQSNMVVLPGRAARSLHAGISRVQERQSVA